MHRDGFLIEGSNEIKEWRKLGSWKVENICMSNTHYLNTGTKECWNNLRIWREWKVIELQKWYWSGMSSGGGEHWVGGWKENKHDQQRPHKEDADDRDLCRNKISLWRRMAAIL